MLWLNVAAVVLGIALSLAVLTACGSQVGVTQDNKGLYSKLDIPVLRGPPEPSQPGIQPSRSQSQEPLPNQGRESSKPSLFSDWFSH
jgi:hypothetical protein